MIHNKINIKPQATKAMMRVLGAIFIASALTSCSSLVDHSVCDLRVLSLQIPMQSKDALKGNHEVIDQLQKSQAKLKQVLPSVAKQLSDQREAENILKDGDVIGANIDLIIKNQKSLNHIYDSVIVVADVIPSIQAEYNLMVDQMARDNYPSTQVVLAKNQVFIAERILRSSASVVNKGADITLSVEDFNADVEILNTYIKAQLEGNPELGVQRINDPELRESLLSIQSDTTEVLLPASLNLLKNSEQIVRVSHAIKDNQEKSADIFNKIKNLE